MFKRVDHVEIVSVSAERTIDFYVNILGFRIKSRTEVKMAPMKEVIFLELGDTTIEVISVDNPKPKTEDLGTMTDDSVDYPDFAASVSSAVTSGSADRGILVCGTGIGISIAANKFPGVRAAVVHDEFTAQMSKQHNNANIIALGGRIMPPDQACRLVDVWLNAEYEGGRHQLRLDKITRLEEDIQAGRI